MTAHSTAEFARPAEFEKHAWLKDWLDASSYGPFGHLQALLVGFIVGSIAFLIGDAALNPTPGQRTELPIFLAFAGGASVLLLCLAIVGNYLIGRRIREEVELERTMFAAGTLPPPLPVPDEPGIDLRPDPRTAEGAPKRPLPARRELELQ
jgi:hypothetical protein